jgi:Subtilase family
MAIHLRSGLRQRLEATSRTVQRLLMNIIKRPALLFCSGLLAGQSILAQNPTIDRIENTGAFLVKLKPQVATRAVVQDEWDLTPLVSDAQTRGEVTPVGNWWYLEPRSKPPARGSPAIVSPKGWDAAYELYSGKPTSGRTRSATRGPLVTRGIKTDEVEFIEPDFRYFLPSPSNSKTGATASASPIPGRAVAGSDQTSHWPKFANVGDYQEAGYSQLKPAREAVEAKLAGISEPDKVRVRVAFFDNGYDPNHITCPPHVNKDLARNFVEGKKSFDGIPLKTNPGLAGSQSHGTGTIGIFGGGPIDLIDSTGNVRFSGTLGGAPMAEIVPMRVATSVIHIENPLDDEFPLIKIRSSGTTRAIHYAIAKNCDVISMSHGGLPSKALSDAINAAYEHGIAMFFASGDYLQPPKWPIHSPSYVVYPAAFRRTICVCGVTADFKTYGKPPKETYDPSDGPVESWRLRGNWGPPAWMNYAIAGFSPNIPWAHLPNPKLHETNETVIDLDGQGTSSSTPQVAAAATLWLQYYRDDPDLKNAWRTWRKAEMVYQALLTSAKKVSDSSDSDYSGKYFGNGVLQAKNALNKKPKDISVTLQKKASVGLGWLRLISSVAARTRAPGVSDDVLKEMFGLEIAQLVQHSVKLQDVIEKYDQAEPDEDANMSEENLAKFQKEFLTVLKDEPEASTHLKDAAKRSLSET